MWYPNKNFTIRQNGGVYLSKEFENYLQSKGITADYQFLESRLKKVEKVFQTAIIPELLGKWRVYDHDEEASGSWCYCQEPLGGAMIGCNNPPSPIKWFYKSCLRMDSDPEGK